MRIEVGGPGIKRIFLITWGLLILSLILPVAVSGRMQRFYLIAQICLFSGTFILAVFMALERKKGIRHITSDIFANLTLCAAAGVGVQTLYTGLPLIPLVFFVGFPYTVFARRFSFFWVPAFVLWVAAAGRYLFLNNPELIFWAAVFLLYSAVLGARMARDGRRIEHLGSMVKRINSDAREMMERIGEDSFSESFDRIRSEDAARAIAIDEDDFLQRLLKWGCRVFNARTGILLVPDEDDPGFFRMRAAVHRGVEILEGLVPADKGFIHITREREGTLCVSDASSARKSLSFYPEDTPVGSFLVKIVTDPKWGKDAGDGIVSEKIRCVLYFDSETANSMSLDDLTSKRLDEFGSLVLKAMDTAGHLQKLTKEVSSRDAISRYARGLTQSLDPEEIGKMALDAVVDAVRQCDGAVVMLFEEGGLSVKASEGNLVDNIGNERILRDEPSQMGLLLRHIAELESGQGVKDAQNAEIVIDSRRAKKSLFFRKGEQLGSIISFAAIPCYMSGSDKPLKAAIAVVSSQPNAFGREELEELRTIAGMMAPALDNAIAHKQVDELSRTDGLTGLLNHRTFQIVLDGKLNHLIRGNFRSVAAIMVDADRFKDVNDTYGHPVGDEVLVVWARRLKMGVRKNDAVARYGGEEFAVILDNAGEKEAREIAEKMRHSIRSRPFATSGGKIQVTASFGFSVLIGADGYAKKELLEQADQALYQAKEGGRDRVVSYMDIDTDATEIEPVAEDANTAIQEGRR
jgi:diguanylate cyclase (GGDEF)-like protein